MKMVKSLLLGSAAGLVAIASAQAADLPVKAKPVQYVKICSLYGAGFYYVPGTDICLKVGGYVRTQQNWNSGGNLTTGPLVGNENTRGTANYVWRNRAYITADARQQTAYGTVRSFVAVGLSGDNAIAFNSNRAFIQFAGFTFGNAVSFYDIYSSASTSFFGGKLNPASDTGDAGQFLTAYTAQFGNGLSASISAEPPQQNRAQGTFNAGGITIGAGGAAAAAVNALALTGTPANSVIGSQFPDVVANLRIDQAWGSAQIMGAIHDVSGQYYGATNGTGHPSNKLGFALGAGFKLNAPMFGPGDYLQAQVNYTEGALGYIIGGAAFKYAAFSNNNSFGQGVAVDAVYGGSAALGASNVELTKAWSINAAYEHFWSPAWQTSLYGVYVNTKFSDTANTLLCNSLAATSATSAPLCAASGSFNWNYWAVGSRTQWNVNKNFYIGVDVIYTKLDQNMNGSATFAASGTRSAGVYQYGDQDAWVAQFRVHRDFGF